MRECVCAHVESRPGARGEGWSRQLFEVLVQQLHKGKVQQADTGLLVLATRRTQGEKRLITRL